MSDELMLQGPSETQGHEPTAPGIPQDPLEDDAQEDDARPGDEEAAPLSQEAVSTLTSLFNDMVTAEFSPNMGVFEGRTMPRDEALAAQLALNEFRFLIRGDELPAHVVPSLSFNPLPASRDNPSLNPPPGSVRTWSRTTYEYDLAAAGVGDGKVKMPFITLADCYIDLRPKMNRQGEPVQRYGTGWVNVLIGARAYCAMIKQITDVTGFDIEDQGATATQDNKYVRTVVSMKERQTPYVAVLTAVRNESDEITTFSSDRAGCVEECYATPAYQEVLGGVFAFTPTFTALCPAGAREPQSGETVKMKLRLVSVRVLIFGDESITSCFSLSEQDVRY